MSEMAVVDQPVRFPATCVCGNQNGPVVDTMIELASGHVYLCQRCVREAARKIGWLPPEDMRSMADAYEQLVSETQTLRAELEYEREHKLVDAHEFADYLREQAAGAAKASS